MFSSFLVSCIHTGVHACKQINMEAERLTNMTLNMNRLLMDMHVPFICK